MAEGSATVALRMAEELGDRVRLGRRCGPSRSRAGGCAVRADTGELVSAGAVVSALPVGPLRDVAVEGVSDARLESLHRQRHALAAKFVAAYARPFWRDGGQNGLTESEGILGSSWPQSEGILSCLVPPERIAAYLSTAPRSAGGGAGRAGGLVRRRRHRPGGDVRAAVGHRPVDPGLRHPVAPGDVHRVGPLHGTHEPPFYVCGSDQWVAGYMEGAVRTGRSAAAEALARG